MIKYRLAVPKDYKNLKELNDIFNGKDSSRLSEILDSLKNNSEEIILVSEYENNLIGFCCGRIIKSFCYTHKYGEITELFVLEEYRNKKIGKNLIIKMEEILKSKGAINIQLFTGRENYIAQNFYEKLNYTKSKELIYRKTNI